MITAQVGLQVARYLQLRRCRAATSRPGSAQRCCSVRPVDGDVDAGRVLRVSVDTVGRSIRVRVGRDRYVVGVGGDANVVRMWYRMIMCRITLGFRVEMPGRISTAIIKPER